MSDVDIAAIRQRQQSRPSPKHITPGTAYAWLRECEADIRSLLATLDEERRQRADLEHELEEARELLTATADELNRWSCGEFVERRFALAHVCHIASPRSGRTKMSAESYYTASQFLADYASRSHATQQQILERRVVVPCQCGATDCRGWAMIPKDCAVEDHTSPTGWSDELRAPWQLQDEPTP
jgi:hypothetical protein